MLPVSSDRVRRLRVDLQPGLFNGISTVREYGRKFPFSYRNVRCFFVFAKFLILPDLTLLGPLPMRAFGLR